MDIVVTLPKPEHENDDRKTEAFLKNDGSYQFWKLGICPTKLSVGDRVHFIRQGWIGSSMRVFDIKGDSEQGCDVTGRIWKGRTILYLGDLQYYEDKIKAKGFRSFRYKWW